ncbi:MAG: competence/damage-inducible protein A [Roseibacillus sp.]
MVPTVRIELLTTGTELMLGTTQNTHGAWIGQRLFSLGLRVERQITVPDGQAVIEAMKTGLEAGDVLIVTGGLGPTSDDLTREALAEVLGLEMIEDEAALRAIEEFFASRGRVMVPANRKQAMAPVGADILANPKGTAPGLYVPPRMSGERNCAVFLLPGPPRELYPMFEEEVVPRLEALAGIEQPPEMVELKFVGIGESDFHQGIDEQLAAVAGLEHGYCARLGEVDLRLMGTPEAIGNGRRIAEAAFARELVSDDGAILEEVVVRLLKEQGVSLAIAESCTGGLIATRITDVPGASEVFRYGFVTYANEAKRDLLDVSWDDLLEHGAVSEPVAGQMAEGALRVGKADLAVSVTGIAGPTGGTEAKPVGTVFLGLAVKGGKTEVVKQFHPWGRDAFKRQVSQAALNLVRRALGDGGAEGSRRSKV